MCDIDAKSYVFVGTRYKRRGVDEEGNCANYVETEQVTNTVHKMINFVMVDLIKAKMIPAHNDWQS